MSLVATDPPHLRPEKSSGLPSVSVGEVEQVMRHPADSTPGWASVRECHMSQAASSFGAVVESLVERVARLVGAEPAAWEERAAPWQPPGAVEGGNERF